MYGGPADLDPRSLLLEAVDAGMILDTADVYEPSEEIIGETLGSMRTKAVICTKFGIVRLPKPGQPAEICGRPEYVRKAVHKSLRRLRTDYIDVLYQHRADTAVPIEETVGAMAELVAEGKVLHLGLSEASAETIRRAAGVWPIAALQSEWSIWSRDVELHIVPTCRALGVTIVPFSPLGRGALTGRLASIDDFVPEDSRRFYPRFGPDVLESNLATVDIVRQIASTKGSTPGQVALAWLLSKGEDVIPIPGTKRVAYLRENLEASDVQLTTDEIAQLDAIRVSGDRTYDQGFINRDTPLPSPAD